MRATPRTSCALLDEKLLASEPGDRYFFEHALLRQAAYGSLLRVNRTLLHSVAADIILELLVIGSASELEHAIALAHHLERSERFSQAHEIACHIMNLESSRGKEDEARSWDCTANRLWDKAKTNNLTLPDFSEWYLHASALTYFRKGDLDKARLKLNEAYSVAQSQQNIKFLPQILLNIAEWIRKDTSIIIPIINVNKKINSTILFEKRKLQSEEIIRHVIVLAKQLGDRGLESKALNSLSMALFIRAKQKEAEKVALEALAIAESSGNEAQIANTSKLLGWQLRYMGRDADADKCAQRALDWYIKSGDLVGEISSRTALVCNLSDQEAINTFHSLLALTRQLGRVLLEKEIIQIMGERYLHMGYTNPRYLHQALLCYNRCLEISSEFGSIDGQANAHGFIGLILRDMNRTSDAVAEFMEALEMYQRLEDGYGEGWIRMELGFSLIKECQIEAASEHLARSQFLLETLEDSRLLSFTHLSWAHWHLARTFNSPQSSVCAALISFNKARALAKQVFADSISELGRYITKARAAIIAFTREHGLEAEVVDLIAEHEREQAELARLRAEREGQA